MIRPHVSLEFEAQSFKKFSASLVGDYFVCSHELNMWFRGDIVRRSYMLVSPKGQRIKDYL